MADEMRIMIWALMIVLLFNAVSTGHAIADQGIYNARALASANNSCGELSDSQLEIIGDYYMEQMMPASGKSSRFDESCRWI
jgi:hypothetical protein